MSVFGIGFAIFVGASFASLAYIFFEAVEALQGIQYELKDMNRLARERWQDEYTTGRIEKPSKVRA